jgi:hypothetical protein
MIAACVGEAEAPQPGDASFTRMLTKALKRYAENTTDVFSAADIHRYIVSQVELHNANKKATDKNGDGDWAATPVLLRINGVSSEPSIQLRNFRNGADGLGRVWKVSNPSTPTTDKAVCSADTSWNGHCEHWRRPDSQSEI